MDNLPPVDAATPPVDTPAPPAAPPAAPPVVVPPATPPPAKAPGWLDGVKLTDVIAVALGVAALGAIIYASMVQIKKIRQERTETQRELDEVKANMDKMMGNYSA